MSLPEGFSHIKNQIVTEVPAGTTAVLNCESNDYDHNFMFWMFDKNRIIGPGNDYDEHKYKYEVLSGKLFIHSVLPDETGFYRCVSKNLQGSGISVGEVEMIVKDTPFMALDVLKLIAIVISIIVIIGCGVIYWRLRKDWNKYDGRSIIPVDETDDDDGEEVYNRTTTSINYNQPQPGPSRNQSTDHLLYGIDNQGLDTDFNSVFQNIQIKSPPASLI